MFHWCLAPPLHCQRWITRCVHPVAEAVYQKLSAHIIFHALEALFSFFSNLHSAVNPDPKVRLENWPKVEMKTCCLCYWAWCPMETHTEREANPNPKWYLEGKKSQQEHAKTLLGSVLCLGLCSRCRKPRLLSCILPDLRMYLGCLGLITFNLMFQGQKDISQLWTIDSNNRWYLLTCCLKFRDCPATYILYIL